MLVRAATVVEWGRATVVAVRAAAPRREAARMYVCSILRLLLRCAVVSGKTVTVLSRAVEF